MSLSLDRPPAASRKQQTVETGLEELREALLDEQVPAELYASARRLQDELARRRKVAASS